MPEGGRAVYFRQTTSVDTRDLVTLKSRLSPYPGTNIFRADVPENLAAWEVGQVVFLISLSVRPTFQIHSVVYSCYFCCP